MHAFCGHICVRITSWPGRSLCCFPFMAPHSLSHTHARTHAFSSSVSLAAALASGAAEVTFLALCTFCRGRCVIVDDVLTLRTHVYIRTRGRCLEKASLPKAETGVPLICMHSHLQQVHASIPLCKGTQHNELRVYTHNTLRAYSSTGPKYLCTAE